jgi:ankyrin repeat protein
VPQSELLTALIADNVNEVKRLIKEGVDVDTRDPNQWTPLHAASSSGKYAITKLLLSLGADIEAKESMYNSTPLMRAAGEGQYAVVDLLLKKGADTLAVDGMGWSPLFWAAQSSKAKVVKLIGDAGVNIMLLTQDEDEGLAAGSSVLHIVATAKEAIDEKNRAERYLPSFHDNNLQVHPAVATTEALLLIGGKELLELKDGVRLQT